MYLAWVYVLLITILHEIALSVSLLDLASQAPSANVSVLSEARHLMTILHEIAA